MPPDRRKAKAEKSPYQWICGRMPLIRHMELIAHGGFGEVHKVHIAIPSLGPYSAANSVDAQ
jgi:hypothetical protein